uniref:Sec20 C-terminal domain-containing protein n=1 Tax=Pseudictyota dubia TaxID=2749911 RepID=A0A7R9YW39_9STRA|mmetsp:Transcript_10277/g.19735  ORF Transcript_10277/g.19735 Transcript_10277/m.19735 type:complete len:150 (+) Transcript_10277:243-692(+)
MADPRKGRKGRVTYNDERDTLLSSRKNVSEHSGASVKRRRKAQTSTETAAQEESDVTDSFLRINSMMKQGLDRVSAVSDAIDSDGNILKNAKEEQKGMTGVVKGARGTLWVLRAQEMRETVVLWCAVVFFYASALYVLWTRVKIPFLLW